MLLFDYFRICNQMNLRMFYVIEDGSDELFWALRECCKATVLYEFIV